MVNEKEAQKHAESRLHRELIAIKEELRNDVVGPVVASFGFIIALVWRDAINATIQNFLALWGLNSQAYVYQIISAVIVTIIVIIIMIIVTKLGRKKKEGVIERAVAQVQNQQAVAATAPAPPPATQ